MSNNRFSMSLLPLETLRLLSCIVLYKVSQKQLRQCMVQSQTLENNTAKTILNPDRKSLPLQKMLLTL